MGEDGGGHTVNSQRFGINYHHFGWILGVHINVVYSVSQPVSEYLFIESSNRIRRVDAEEEETNLGRGIVAGGQVSAFWEDKAKMWCK